MKSLTDVQPYKYLFVDAMNLCARSYHGMSMLTHNGRPTGMLFGAARLVIEWRKRSPGVKIVFIWEGTKSWRKAKYPIYKSNRDKDAHGDREIYMHAVDQVRESLICMGVEQVWADTYEADDTVWTLSSMVDPEAKRLFVTTDWDWWPLVYQGDILYQNDVYSHDDMVRKFVKKYKCDPIQMNRLWLFKALTGDSSDGISGVPMFPKKLAAILCNNLDVTSNNLYCHLLALGKNTWAEKIRMNKWLVDRNVDLVSPRIPLEEELQAVNGDFNMELFESVLLNSGMDDLHNRLVKGW